MAIDCRRTGQRIFHVAGTARLASARGMGLHHQRRLSLADSQRRGLLFGRLGADMAMGLYVTAAQAHPRPSPVPRRRHRLHGQQHLPLPRW